MPMDGVFIEAIDRELAWARTATREGNNGKARVCARRAAGAAIALYLAHQSNVSWGTDAVTQLNHLHSDAAFPADVRDAAQRLTTRITREFEYSDSFDPVADAKLIADYIIQLMNAQLR